MENELAEHVFSYDMAGYLKLRYPGSWGRRKWRPKEEMEERERERERE